MDQIGLINVPEINPSGIFPLVPDYPHGRAHRSEVVIHRFGSANAKIEQRFLLGTGAKRFTVRRAYLRESDRVALRDFWEDHYGPHGAFTYNAPNDDGGGTTPFTCRFANEPLSWEMVSDAVCSLGVTLIEVPTSSPTYPLNQTVTRFPTSSLATALLSQVQELIPLVKIQPLEAGYPAIYVSDRRCTIGGQLYQARLLDFDGISQSIGNEADEGRFTFGNADRVMRDLANDVDLFRAALEFSLFHVGTGIKLDLWKGDLVNWAMDAGPEFQVTAADGLYELNLPYPTRRVSRSCWKQFNDGFGCPFATEGALDLTNFPQADVTKCDKGYDTPNGCRAHGMKLRFGGIIARPQGVRIKDNSTGTWGFGRSTITSVSLVAESIYDEVVPEIYTDADLPINCKIAAGRDESDFYVALGIVGEGPIGAFGSGHKLDNQLNHGPGNLGLRLVPGRDPTVESYDFFALGAPSTPLPGEETFAAGTAFIELRRSDSKGLQLSRPGEHQMQAVIAQGLSGWVWTAPGVRAQQVLTNPIWIVVNALLRARGLRFADAATAEQFFDVEAAIAAANICDLQVTKLVGSGNETQFKFRGVLQEEKPLRDWIQEILMNGLGYYTFAFGKLKIGVRANSSTLEAFTEGNILFQSLQLAPLKPNFNHLTANFADEEFEYAVNSISLYDIDHAKLIGGATSPLFLKSNVNLSGSSSKSQAARIIAVRLREELGGVTAAEWKAARQVSFRTTVLALAVEPGMVCSMTHPDMPGGAGEFRVTGWRLNKDFSIDIQGRSSTDSMYDLVDGPKPADVSASPVPVESLGDRATPPAGSFGISTPGDGSIGFSALGWPSTDNVHSIDHLTFTVWAYNELDEAKTSLAAALDQLGTTVLVPTTELFEDETSPGAGDGDVVIIGTERVRIVSIAKGSPNDTWTVERGVLEQPITLDPTAGYSIVRSGGVVTVYGTIAHSFVPGVTRVIVAGVDDSSFDGEFVVQSWQTDRFTYAQAGPDATSSGGTVTGWTRAAHSVGVTAYRADRHNLPFSVPVGFFPLRLFNRSASLPFRRIATVEMASHNAFGESPVSRFDYLEGFTEPAGLRTNGGGQYILQLAGVLAVQAQPVPPVPVEARSSIRDIYAVVGTAPAGAAITIAVRRNGAIIATLTISAGSTVSNNVAGAALPVMSAGDLLTFDVTGVGATEPGRDLAVVVRT